MTYAEFHLVFILPPIFLLGLAVWRGRRTRGAGPDALGYLGLIAAVAFAYTIPWDNYLVYREVWGYGADRVLATIGYVPVEEYAFFILQPFLTGLWYLLVRARLGHVAAASGSGRAKWAGVGFWAAVTVVGAALWVAGGHGLYLGLILAWAGPVLAGMWWLAGAALWANRRALAWAIGPPTLWLWVADRIAIGLGIWYIADPTRTGFDPLGLPVEEALFFLLTNVLVAQGLLLLSLRRAEPVGAAAAT
jgi:lycopene cyclase domain-containing protein